MAPRAELSSLPGPGCVFRLSQPPILSIAGNRQLRSPGSGVWRCGVRRRLSGHVRAGARFRRLLYEPTRWWQQESGVATKLGPLAPRRGGPARRCAVRYAVAGQLVSSATWMREAWRLMISSNSAGLQTSSTALTGSVLPARPSISSPALRRREATRRALLVASGVRPSGTSSMKLAGPLSTRARRGRCMAYRPNIARLAWPAEQDGGSGAADG